MKSVKVEAGTTLPPLSVLVIGSKRSGSTGMSTERPDDSEATGATGTIGHGRRRAGIGFFISASETSFKYLGIIVNIQYTNNSEILYLQTEDHSSRNESPGFFFKAFDMTPVSLSLLQIPTSS